MVAWAGAGNAQKSMPKMAIGIQGGGHTSWTSFSGTPAIQRSYLPGIRGGIQFQYMSRPMLGFETNVLYTTVGWQERHSQGFYSRKINAIEWQVNTHLSIGKKALRLLVDAGPYMRFFISESVDAPDASQEADFPQYFLPFEHNFQYGLLVGGGLGLRLPKFIIQARGHFHLGLTNFFNTDFANFFASSDQVAGGSLSVLLPFGQPIN